ncbi:MAG: TetR/AcrR family transcriptional regulator [Mycolicibacterium sp.]|nr:TetR/AcrR family transcriptional regulator [Mycolicibacterium sp.]
MLPARDGPLWPKVVARRGLGRSAGPSRYSKPVRRPSRPHPGTQPGVKVDARSERWREHRKKVRAEIVDAAFRAIDHLGPELSLREIAEEAGTAKPKIYRHFTDKADLFQAIGERLRDMLWAAIIPSINVSADPAREVIRRSVEQYVYLVDEHPNVCRFLIQGRFAEQSESTMRALNEGRDITLAMAAIFNDELREMDLDGSAIELAAFTTFGSAAAATEWWLGPGSDSPRRMPPEKFIAYMTTIMLGAINGTCELLGIKIDPELPLHEGVRRRESVA